MPRNKHQKAQDQNAKEKRDLMKNGFWLVDHNMMANAGIDPNQAMTCTECGAINSPNRTNCFACNTPAHRFAHDEERPADQ